MLEGWTHRARRRVAIALAVAVVGAVALVSTVSATPQSPQRRTATMAALAATAIRAHGARTPALSGVMLGGFTASDWPVVAQLARTGKKVSEIAIGLDMSCTPSGTKFSTSDNWVKLAIDRHGAFGASYAYPPNGSLLGGTDTVIAHLDRKHQTISGTWRLELNYSNTNAPADQCDSGTVKFKLMQ